MSWKADAWICEMGHVIDCGPLERWLGDTPTCPVRYKVTLGVISGLYTCDKECRAPATHIKFMSPEYEAAWITGGLWAVTALWEAKTGKKVPV